MVAQILDRLVSDRVGILSAISEVRIHPGAPQFFHFAAHLCNTLALSEYANSGSRGAAAADRATAVTRVTLDAVAGYCSALISEEDGRHAICTAEEAPFRCVRPEDFALFGASQYVQAGFPWVPFTGDTPVQWSEGLDPLTDEAVFLPSAMRFLPYAAMVGHGEALIAPATSTGLACHWDTATAVTEAICDVIQCDALALLWQGQMRAPQIRVETLSDANYDLVSRFERTGASITLLKVELDVGVPTILAVLSNSSPSAPARVFAAGTSMDPEQSVRISLEMLAHVHQYCHLVFSQRPRVSQDPAGIVDQSDQLNFWCDHANAAGADFLFASDERVEFDELRNQSSGRPKQDLAKLLEMVRKAGYRTILANLTTPDIAELGLTVVRAMIPGFHPLFCGYQTRALGGERLWTIPQELGQKGVKRERGDNPLPHPFPRKGMAS